MEMMEENIDKLFKEAGENYPLKINEGDWDKVFGSIKNPNTGINKMWYAAAIFLLAIPLAIWLYNSSPQNQSVANASNKQKANKEQTVSPVNKNTEPSVAPEANVPVNDDDIAPNKNIGPAANYPAFANIKKGNRIFSTPNILNPRTTNQQSNNDFGLNNNSPQKNEDVVTQKNTISQQNTNTNTEVNNADVSVTKNTDSFNQQSQNISETKKQPITLKNTPHRFYFGLLASPIFSSVKSQDFKAGSSIGLFAGINVTNNISFEIGIRKECRAVYTKGQNFSNEYLKQRKTTNITMADGKANVLNIPFSLRYNFNSKNNNNFFVSAGTNAIVAKREEYNFDLMRNGTPDNVNRAFYNRPPDKLFADINISAGYKLSVLKNASLRIEPWYSLPLSGIGIGNVKANNIGINLGVAVGFK